MPIVDWLNKLWHSHTTEYYYAIKKEQTLVMYDLDESQKHDARSKKPDATECILYDYLYEV